MSLIYIYADSNKILPCVYCISMLQLIVYMYYGRIRVEKKLVTCRTFRFFDVFIMHRVFAPMYVTKDVENMTEEEERKIHRRLEVKIGRNCFIEVGGEMGIVTLCGGIRTIIKFSLYRYRGEDQGRSTATNIQAHPTDRDEARPDQPTTSTLVDHESATCEVDSAFVPQASPPSDNIQCQLGHTGGSAVVMPAAAAARVESTNSTQSQQEELTLEEMYYMNKWTGTTFPQLPPDYRPPSHHSSTSESSEEEDPPNA